MLFHSKNQLKFIFVVVTFNNPEIGTEASMGESESHLTGFFSSTLHLLLFATFKNYYAMLRTEKHCRKRIYIFTW